VSHVWPWRLLSSEMLHHVVWCVRTDISEELLPPFSEYVEDEGSRKIGFWNCSLGNLSWSVTAVSGQCFSSIFSRQDDHSSWTHWPLKTELMRCPETSAKSQHTLRNNPKERKSRNLAVFIPDYTASDPARLSPWVIFKPILQAFFFSWIPNPVHCYNVPYSVSII
jgi:hypothetical protein